MSNDTVVSLAAPAPVPDPLTELLRSGARRLVEAAVRVEFEEHLSSFGHEKLPDGRQRVVRNGRLLEAQDSHRARRGGRAGPQGAQPLGLPRAVPLLGGAALRSALCEPGCGDPVAVTARGVDRADASGGRCAGGRGCSARAVGERGQSSQA